MYKKKTEVKENNINELVEQIENKKPKKEKEEVWFDSGLTRLNLSLSDHPERSFLGGSIVNIAGHKQTGKTQLNLMILAKAIYSGMDYDFIFDDAEAALNFDISCNFGSETKKKLGIKSINDTDNLCSKTVEDLERNLIKQIYKKKPFIYAMDSLDCLPCDAEIKRHSDKKYLAGKELDGSYNMERAKLIGTTFKLVNKAIKETNSLFIINSQARDNVGFGFTKDTRSGGRAIDFYISYMIWLKVKKTLKEKNLKTGKNIQFSITKNRNNSQYFERVGGKLRDGEFTVLDEIGIDNVGTNCQYLIERDYWKKDGKKYAINDFNDPTTRSGEDIPKWIEENDHEEKLKQICYDEWIKTEESVIQGRKPNF
jgi:RecA/RadA recombinase